MTIKEAWAEAVKRWGKNAVLYYKKGERELEISSSPKGFRVATQTVVGTFSASDSVHIRGWGRTWEQAFAVADDQDRFDWIIPRPKAWKRISNRYDHKVYPDGKYHPGYLIIAGLLDEMDCFQDE
jgi:hypothetical protein